MQVEYTAHQPSLDSPFEWITENIAQAQFKTSVGEGNQKLSNVNQTTGLFREL